jgi:hypothetical protein
MARPHSGRFCMPPAERTPPFYLFLRDRNGLRLVAPFAKRRRGRTVEEAEMGRSGRSAFFAASERSSLV